VRFEKKDWCSPEFLTRHDESSANVTILDESFPIWHAEVLSELKSGDPRSIGYGDNDIDLDPFFHEFRFRVHGESVSHRHTRSIDRDTVDD